MKENDTRESSIRPLLVVGLVVILLWVISLILLTGFFEDWNSAGTFGDSFGALNTLFSGLAFAGIIYTILLQRKELMLQREELTESRKQLEASAIAHQELVRLTKTVNRDKIFPSLSIFNFKLEDNTYWIAFQVRDAALFFKEMRRGKQTLEHMEFGYSTSEGSMGLKNEGDLLTGIQFQSRYIDEEFNVITVYFSDAFGKEFCQEMIVEKEKAYLGPVLNLLDIRIENLRF